MFNQRQNNCAMIRPMGKTSELTEQMKRLYMAAWDLKRVRGKSAVARLLNVLPQALNNWENGRDISSEALIAAYENIGCNIFWLRDGTGSMTNGVQSPNVYFVRLDKDEIEFLANLQAMHADDKKSFLKAIKAFEKARPVSIISPFVDHKF